jgi:SpoVK/Ycf46/Vps4 family AAA+-type ATPase
MSKLQWQDIVLPPRTLAEVQELENWIRNGDTLMNQWNMRHKLRPGCRALFFGPPGTGKTLTATVLGKVTGRQVYKVDLSMVVSKYIGETEKNLAGLFDRAEHKDWILFFDEADALFGKRTQVRDAHDRYANQEVSFPVAAHRDLPRTRNSRIQPRESCRRSIRTPIRATGSFPDAASE